MIDQFTHIKKVAANPSPALVIDHPKARAEISLYGGQLLCFSPKSKRSLIWQSQSMNRSGEKPLRGGTPLCWPWFGPSKIPGAPQHGYIRSMQWQITELFESEDKVVLELSPPADALSKLGIEATVKVRYDIGDELSISLITYNLGSDAMPLTQAIHTYFSVQDINQAEIEGLGNSEYLDQLTNEVNRQNGAVKITEETDRIYHTTEPVVLLKEGRQRIEIQSAGHDSIVVWNPWKTKAETMPDFDNEGYRHMVCIETASTKGLVLEGNAHCLLQQAIRCV